MKRIIKGIIFTICLFSFCIGCEGDVTRALRHAGYNLSGEGNTKFVCDAFFGENATEFVRFLTPTHFITDEGVLYEISTGKKFSNDQNCRLANTPLRVAALYDNTVFLANNGGIYKLVGDNEGEAYTEILPTDRTYNQYAALLHGSNSIKYVTVDGTNGIVYGLSNDGNVYGYTLYKSDNNAPLEIVGYVIVYNQLDYGQIMDFGYYGNSPTTYVRTADNFYHLTVTNQEDCTTYADVKCNYVMTEDEILRENAEHIMAFNGGTIFTDYGRVFTMATDK